MDNGAADINTEAYPQAGLPQLEERPLVTFALFAYNQEKYIREAVEGAFSQTYQPLEIILSDDCSSDRTFEIMQEMAAAYEGAHTLRLRRSEINFGTAMHVEAVARAACGDLLVVAAGDDISQQNRVAELVSAWLGAGRFRGVIHSAMAVADPSDPCSQHVIVRARDSFQDLPPAWAPTCAYTLDLFRDFPPMLGGSLIEDGVLLSRNSFAGQFLAVDQPLVVQRLVAGSAGRVTSFSEPARWNRHLRSKIICALNNIQDLQFATELAPDEKARLERIRLRAIKRASQLFIRQSTPPNLLECIAISLRLILAFGTLGGLKSRLAIALRSLHLQYATKAGQTKSQVCPNTEIP